jgi:hypothetical protein
MTSTRAARAAGNADAMTEAARSRRAEPTTGNVPGMGMAASAPSRERE